MTKDPTNCLPSKTCILKPYVFREDNTLKTTRSSSKNSYLHKTIHTSVCLQPKYLHYDLPSVKNAFSAMRSTHCWEKRVVSSCRRTIYLNSKSVLHNDEEEENLTTTNKIHKILFPPMLMLPSQNPSTDITQRTTVKIRVFCLPNLSPANPVMTRLNAFTPFDTASNVAPNVAE